MTVFSVHVIHYVNFCDGVQPDYPVWWSTYLVDCKDVDEAVRIGRVRAKSVGSIITCDDREARLLFGGIRVIMEVFDNSKGNVQVTGCPEVASFQLQVKDREALDRLIDGSEVRAIIDDVSGE